MGHETPTDPLDLQEGGLGMDAVNTVPIDDAQMDGEFLVGHPDVLVAYVGGGRYFRRRSMATYLDQLAEALLREHGHALDKVAVVLPSQRAGLYLRGALARGAGRALWSPEVFTLPSFMERLSGLRTLPMEELLFEAYEAYRTLGGDLRPLEDFIEWAPTTLADVSEADANMVRLDGFYRDLRSWEELEWSFNSDPLSEGQQRMVRYWALAGRLHGALNERLLTGNSGTSGLVARMAVSRVPSAFSWDRIWFAGLNAFTVAEARVLDAAQEAGSARFAWDADRYYLDDPQQEAGEHLRSALKRWGPGEIPTMDHLREAAQRITVMRAPNPVSQVWCAADRLRAMAPEERTMTSVLLADETLLPALLEALPADSGAVNITMGLSLATLPLGSLLDRFFRGSADAGTTGTWSMRSMEEILRHPYLRIQGQEALLEETLSRLGAQRSARLDPLQLRAAWSGWAAEFAVFAEAAFGTGSGLTMRDRILALLGWAARAMREDDFATEQIFQASIMLGKAAGLVERYGHASSAVSWIAIMTRLLRISRIGLFGEPLSGLQVMGLLEARGLDPQRIILLGAQEGKLPTSTIERSYIPYELRRAYGLPLRDSSDAVQAYNFMRLLHRAEVVDLVYPEDGTSNSPSRYIAQLRNELFARRPEQLTWIDTRVPVPVRTPRPTTVPNDPVNIARLEALLSRGLSPTMVRAWSSCPLDLWFRYVCGLKEPDDPGVRLGGDVLGEALHGVLEDIHRPWLGRPLVASEVEAAIPGTGDALRARLSAGPSASGLLTGQPLLQLGMATRAAANFLRAEARSVRDGARMIPLALELELRAELRTVVLGNGRHAVIKGRLDRVDERDGMVHVLDLKTGRVDGSALRIEEVDADALKGDKGYAAQLLLYAWLYLTVHPDVPELRAGLQPMQQAAGSEGLFLRIGDRDVLTRADLPAITEVLTVTVRAMLDPMTTYRHDPSSRYCAFCA